MSRIVTLWISVLLAGAAVAAPAPPPIEHGGAGQPPIVDPTVAGDVLALHCDGKGAIDVITETARFVRSFRRMAPESRPHPAAALLEKNELPVPIAFGPDGKTAIVPLLEVLVDTETGKSLVDGNDVRKALGGPVRAQAGAVSANGRWSAWSASNLDPKGATSTVGVAFFDRETKKITAGPRGFLTPTWVSTDGNLFSAEAAGGKNRNLRFIVDRAGKILFPKAGDPKLVPSSVGQSADGGRIALAVRLGDGTVALRVYSMPGFRLLREHVQSGVSSGTLTPDGRFLLLQATGPSGANGAIASSFSLVEVATGSAVDVGNRLSGSWAQPCSRVPGSFATVRSDGEGRSLVETVQLGTLLEASALPRFATAKERFGADILSADGTRAWRALLALRAQGVTRAEAKTAAGTLPVFGEADRKLVAGLGARFASTDFAEREQAAAAARGLIERFDENTFRAKVLPTLEALRRSEDAEVRAQARALLRYQPGRGTVTAAVLASRLELLEP